MSWLVEHPIVPFVLVLLGIGGLVYWWKRPVSWEDGEGPVRDESDLMDTDLGSTRWSLVRDSDVGFLLRLQAWWENERRRGRKDD